jgi:signal transduction histidine kinase
LAIARSIVDAHDGGIELRTARGRGCSFSVRLPRAGRSGP